MPIVILTTAAAVVVVDLAEIITAGRDAEASRVPQEDFSSPGLFMALRAKVAPYFYLKRSLKLPGFAPNVFSMEFDQQIQNGIEAHSEWKQRLNASISTGQSSHAVAVVCQEDQCALGRWLLGLDETTKTTNRWQCIRTTHAAFHREAAQILELALNGNQRGARSRMTYSSPFAGLSNKLVMELTAWKREPLHKTGAVPAASYVPEAV